MPGPPPLTVAFDVSPLAEFRTGIGFAVQGMVDALAEEPGLTVVPYVLSRRARAARSHLPHGTRLPRMPARLLRPGRGRLSIGRFVTPARVLHATNYVAPDSGLPTLLTVYDCSFVRDPESCTPEVRAFRTTVAAAVARGATLHTGTAAVAQEIDEYFGPGLVASDRVAVVPFGVPPLVAAGRGAAGSGAAAPVAGVAPGARIVLAVGRHEPRKCFPTLVQAFGALAERDAALVIAGPAGTDTPAIEAACATLTPDVRARVHLVGPVDETTKARLFRAAAVVAMPSRDEGFGFPVLEAMQAGVPVVASTAPALAEVAGGAAVLVPPGDADALAGALAGLLHDGERRADLVARGTARVAAFSWQATARGLVAAYRRLAGD